MWDKVAAERYEAWYTTTRGSFALAREQRLMAEMVSPWQRRNHTLLEIGCGAGHFLEMFHDGGFDVTGIDKSEPMLEKARDRMGSRAALRVGDASHLPFDDGEFDYVAIVTALECMDDPKAALREAFRVAQRGVVIAYLNAWSIYRLEQIFSKLRRRHTRSMAEQKAAKTGESAPASDREHALDRRWFNLFSMCGLLREVSGKRPSEFRSTLFSPSCFWRGVTPFSLSWAQILPFGAMSVVRVDLMPVGATASVIRTPKMTRTQAAQAAAGAISMDSSQKNM